MSLADDLDLVPGQPGPRMDEILRRDHKVVSEKLLEHPNDYLDENHGLPKERYLSYEFHRREVEHLWSRTWQMACRLEQIPNVGDYQLYDIVDKSLIVMRTAPDRAQAFYNACPHRGRTLCEESQGHLSNIRCKFHGMMWRLDGRLGHVPARWDFPHIEDEKFGLPEVKTALWGGFVFINMDPDCIPFSEYIGSLDEHARGWDFENRYIAAHAGLVIRANWKVTTEAFLEDYHSNATHPQVLAYINSSSTQFMAKKDEPHLSRLLFATGVPASYVAANMNEERIFERMREDFCLPGEEAAWTFQPDRTAREQLADIYRKRMSALTNGRDFSDTPESELVDNWVYPLFPSLFLFGGYGNLVWRIRPWGDDPGQSFMEVIFLLPLPEGLPRPAPAKMTMMHAGQKFSDAPELGFAGRFMDQDLSNLEWVQHGLHSSTAETCVLSRYQESLIRHFHRTIDLYLEDRAPRSKPVA